jgi:hypothetical protein
MNAHTKYQVLVNISVMCFAIIVEAYYYYYYYYYSFYGGRDVIFIAITVYTAKDQ